MTGSGGGDEDSSVNWFEIVTRKHMDELGLLIKADTIFGNRKELRYSEICKVFLAMCDCIDFFTRVKINFNYCFYLSV